MEQQRLACAADDNGGALLRVEDGFDVARRRGDDADEEEDLAGEGDEEVEVECGEADGDGLHLLGDAGRKRDKGADGDDAFFRLM